MKIQDLILRPPVTVPPECTIRETADIMRRQGVGAVMVADVGGIVGIVTDRDLVTRALAKRVRDDARIDSVMSMNVIAIDAGSDIRDAVRAFGHHAIRRLPVLNGHLIVGMLTTDDMLVAYTGEIAEITRGVTAQLMFPHAMDEAEHPAKIG